jgi:hypothetical protein
MITVDKVLADLEHDKLMARNHHQYSVSKSCTELQGKYLAMFTDNINNQTTEKHIKLTPEERAELRRMALHLNKTGTDDTHSNNTADGTK